MHGDNICSAIEIRGAHISSKWILWRYKREKKSCRIPIGSDSFLIVLLNVKENNEQASSARFGS